MKIVDSYRRTPEHMDRLSETQTEADMAMPPREVRSALKTRHRGHRRASSLWPYADLCSATKYTLSRSDV